MSRLSRLAFFALAFSAVALAASREIVAAGVTRGTSSWSYTNCETAPSDFVTINSLSFSPDQPEPQDITITVDFDVSEVIEEGATLDYTVQGPTSLQGNFDFCNVVAGYSNSQVQCPVATGHYVTTSTLGFPGSFSDGTYEVRFQGSSVDGCDLFCIDLQFTFSSS